MTTGARHSETIAKSQLCQTRTTQSATVCTESRTRMMADFAALESAKFASLMNFDAMRPVGLFWQVMTDQRRILEKSSRRKVIITD